MPKIRKRFVLLANNREIKEEVECSIFLTGTELPWKLFRSRKTNATKAYSPFSGDFEQLQTSVTRKSAKNAPKKKPTPLTATISNMEVECSS